MRTGQENAPILSEQELEVCQRALDHVFCPVLFVTVSGAHLYGFASADSDIDLRGVYVLPARTILGLDPPRETMERNLDVEGREVDLVMHDAGKYFSMLLSRSGYVLEQIFSPIVIRGGDALEELRRLAKGCITRHVFHHYRGFASSQMEKLSKESQPRIKTLLYIYRVILTGIHLLETGEVEANLLRLNGRFDLPFIPDLVARKKERGERSRLDRSDLLAHEAFVKDLMRRLEEAFESTALPETPSSRRALSDLLVRLRLQGQKEPSGTE